MPPSARVVAPDRYTRRTERRDTLVRAAADAIEVRGAGIGVEEIAEHCGLARPLLYRYFSGLTDLQAAILDHAATDLLSAMSQLGDSRHDDFGETVAEAVHTYLGWVFAHPNLSRYCLQITPASGEINVVRMRIRGILSLLVGPPVYGPDHGGVEAATFIAALAGMAEATAVWWLDGQADVALADLAADLARRIQTLIDAEVNHQSQRRQRGHPRTTQRSDRP